MGTELSNTQENLDSESSSRVNMQKQLKVLDAELLKLQEQLDEEEANSSNMQRTGANQQQQVQNCTIIAFQLLSTSSIAHRMLVRTPLQQGLLKFEGKAVGIL